MARARNRRSARQAGSRFERQIADYLALHVDDRIDKRPGRGTKDRGDIGGLRHLGKRVVIECKDHAHTQLSKWMKEAEIARGNDDATTALFAHKRHGKAHPGHQWVTTTLDNLIALINGNRDHIEKEE